MTVRRAFELLELHPGATLEEAKQAYKDSVSVWHPDRFAHNPRLRNKAERKLQEINAAFAEVNAFLLSREKPRVRAEGPARARPERSAEKGAGSRDTAEAIAETGTRLVLEIWSTLSQAVHSAMGRTGPRVRRRPPPGHPGRGRRNP